MRKNENKQPIKNTKFRLNKYCKKASNNQEPSDGLVLSYKEMRVISS